MEPQVNQTANASEMPDENAPKKRNNRFKFILIAVIVLGGGFGVMKFIHSQNHETTDDAQIDANISPVIPRVSGYVMEVRVKDNQMVKKGDTLVILDNRDAKIKLDLAMAALSAAQGSLSVAHASTSASMATVGTYRANVMTASAQIEAAKVNVWRATQDYNRYSILVKDHSITEQQYEQAVAAKQTAERQLQVLIEQKNAADRQTQAAASQSNATEQQVSVANATIMQKQADVDNAKLNLSYTVVTAPEDGMVSKVNVRTGQFLQAGQNLFSVVAETAPWVVANFKETQLDKMKVGQKVIAKVDAIDGHEFEAKVTSFSPATGSRFALLPPDNASGNFIKVVQRVPVKIEFINAKDEMIKQLRPGMNVDVDVILN